MKVYHGSTVVVKSPDCSFGRPNLDFGQGFYTTNIKMQAEKWEQRFIALGKRAFVTVYEYNLILWNFILHILLTKQPH